MESVLQKSSTRASLQKMGGFLSSMVMPNIGAFIAWGLLAALFIPTGWVPNEYLNQMVGPTIKYLLPLLIGYTGGYNVYGRRGGVIGAVATMGVVIGADITMLIGGMVMGPLAAIILKKVDLLFKGKVKPGLEMLVDNFSLGIVGAVIMILGFMAIEPVFSVILSFISTGVEWVTARNLIPLTSILVQPAQVLFLNNAVNHGIMIPLGLEQAAAAGKSILFLVEGNSGPWVGLLLAFCFFGKGVAKKAAPAASGILFLGGIGEVAFPYALMKPVTILGPIIGNGIALLIMQLLNGGTVAAVSPGSFLALLMMTPKGTFLVNITAYFAAVAASFLVVSFLLKLDKSEENEELAATVTNVDMSRFAGDKTAEHAKAAAPAAISAGKSIHKVIIACDAGMGSSAMGVSILKTKARKAMLDIEISNVSVDHIPDDADLIITNAILEERARAKAPNSKVPILTIKNFLDSNEYEKIIHILKNT
ncbi:PTS transporter subunit EIIC [Brevibacillus sp. B_LB10_24]|uniref:PTS transporter subunit EIIC n=1 Tax=Brevibacillus sp. B_LB10_24 TaxID=3380645 RepID=UPI0038B6F76D